jgi:hypothetical protein
VASAGDGWRQAQVEASASLRCRRIPFLRKGGFDGGRRRRVQADGVMEVLGTARVALWRPPSLPQLGRCGEGKFLEELAEAGGGNVCRRMGAKEVVWTARVALWRPPSSATTIFSLQSYWCLIINCCSLSLSKA